MVLENICSCSLSYNSSLVSELLLKSVEPRRPFKSGICSRLISTILRRKTRRRKWRLKHFVRFCGCLPPNIQGRGRAFCRGGAVMDTLAFLF